MAKLKVTDQNTDQTEKQFHGRVAPKPTPETVRQEVSDILRAHIAASGMYDLPEPMPRKIGDAVEWFCGWLFEPPNAQEVPRMLPVPGDKNDRETKWRWEYAYRNRVVDCLTRFLALQRHDRELIVGYRQDGLHWRGDDMQTFSRIAVEHGRMQEEGKDDYIKNACNRMRAMAQKIDDRNAVLRGDSTAAADRRRQVRESLEKIAPGYAPADDVPF